jgi:hypothetical protein
VLPLPFPDPLGIFLVTKIILVVRHCQPSTLVGAFPGLLAFELGTESLPRPMPVIRKKKFLAVRAFTAVRRSLHRFENQTDHCEEISGEEGRKSRTKKTQNSEEGRKLFSECLEENAGEEDPFLNRPFCGKFKPPLARASERDANPRP